MTLREKTVIIIGVTLIGLIVVLYAASQTILLGSFDDLESQSVLQEAERAQDTLFHEIYHLDSINYDWAAWDDTYEFIENVNEDYTGSNLVDETFKGIRVNVMLFINSSGSIVFGKAFDLQNETKMPVPQSLLDHLSRSTFLLTHPDTDSSIRGFILLSEGPMIISSRPIITSDENGPVRGTLIMGRYLDLAEIERLAGITHLSLNLHRFDDPQMPSDFKTARSSMSEEAAMLAQPLSEESIAGYTMLRDVYGNPTLMLRVDIPRVIHEQGTATMRYFILSILIAGLVFGGVTLSLLERSVLSRLAGLSDNLGSIGKRGELSARVSISGGDELSNLAGEINEMLDALENSQDKLHKIEVKNQAILDAIPDIIFQLRKDGTIFNYKASKDEELFTPPNIFLGRKVYEFLPQEVARQTKFYTEKALETNAVQVFQYQLPINDSIRDYEARLVVSGNDEVLAIVSDITERKQLEEARKKEVLIKEVHHRVKNNLQVISSLLYLQSKKFRDVKIIDMFKESQNRVKSMALAHEELYQSEDLASIDFADYIRKLISNLFQSYGINSNNIKLNTNIENVILGIDTAIPCGLIINELVTNALKHAFPSGEKGEISISFKSGNDKFVLIVSDNGAGFPGDLDFRTTESLGMLLVVSLVKQIEGTIELDRSNGTEFRITFKELVYKERR